MKMENKYIIYCHLMHCKANETIKIECKNELHKKEMIRMLENQDLLSVVIDRIEEIKECE